MVTDHGRGYEIMGATPVWSVVVWDVPAVPMIQVSADSSSGGWGGKLLLLATPDIPVQPSIDVG